MLAIATAGAEESKAKPPITFDGISAKPVPKSEQPLARVQSETDVRKETGNRHPDQTLYGALEEIGGVRIGWHVNETGAAFKKAIDRNMPLVLVVHADWCDYCWKLIDALACPSVNRFAGSAVFAIGSYEIDKTASSIASSLNIEKYPTLAVLYPEARMLIEAGRINGYFPGDKVAKYLTEIQDDYNSKSRRDDIAKLKVTLDEYSRKNRPDDVEPDWLRSYGEWKLGPVRSVPRVLKSSRSSHPARCVE
jgi:hypothetical protein